MIYDRIASFLFLHSSKPSIFTWNDTLLGYYGKSEASLNNIRRPLAIGAVR